MNLNPGINFTWVSMADGAFKKKKKKAGKTQLF